MSDAPFIPKIGIIGGAGPAAGSLLFNRIISICQQDYSCKDDGDFPTIQLINVPFPDMLKAGYDREKVQNCLKQALNFLKLCRTPFFAIACNTLHGFITSEMYSGMEFISLLREPAKVLSIKSCKDALVLCTSTTAKLGLQKPYFNCIYPDESSQKLIDRMIDKILSGKFGKAESSQLEQIIRPFLKINRGIVLGCTEFSVLNEAFPLLLQPENPVIDPLDAAAKTLVAKALNPRRFP